MIETTTTLKCDKPRCNQSTEATISDSTFGHFDVTYQTPENDSGVEGHDFCKKHAEEIRKALVDLGLLSDPSNG